MRNVMGSAALVIATANGNGNGAAEGINYYYMIPNLMI